MITMRRDDHASYLLLELAKPPKELIETALSRLLPRIEVECLAPLNSGYSGSNVYRVSSSITIPFMGLSHQVPTYVVKTNQKDSLFKEKENYNRLPDFKKNYFSKINLDRLFQVNDETNLWLLLMEDLTDYNTLYQSIFDKTMDIMVINNFASSFDDFMNDVYFNEKEGGVENTLGIVKSHYVARFERTINRLLVNGILEKEIKNSDYKKYIGDVINMDDIEPKYVTFCHGDLHTKNIMINENGDIKLVDLDKIIYPGDFMYDIGELYASIRLVSHLDRIKNVDLGEDNYSSFYTTHSIERTKILLSSIDDSLKIIEEKFNTNLRKRLLLSQARFLITCCLYEQSVVKQRIYWEEVLNCLDLIGQ